MTKMRISSLLILFSLFFCPLTWTQTRVGIKAGINTLHVDDETLSISGPNGNEQFKLAVENTKYGINIGLYLLAKSKRFYIQPEVIYNLNTIEYKVDTLGGDGFLSKIYEEKVQNLDIPITMGLRFGFLRIGGGPVGHVFLNDNSDLRDLPGYDPEYEKFTLGYQAGIGIDFWAINLDIRYEGNLTNFGEHFNFFGNEVAFSDSPTRFVGTIGISF